MKRLRSAALAVLCCCLAAAPVSAGELPGADSARSACLTESATGTVLYEKNADERLPMASTTKIMTAYASLGVLDPETVITVAPEACGIEGSGIGLVPGEELTLEDLLWAVMLESANDAAAAVAYGVSGGIGEFAALMNETAAGLGLKDTHFVNPHGLDDEDHFTTARDLAKLAAAAMDLPLIRTMAGTVRHEIAKPDGTRTLINHNRLLRECPDIIGVKTGFTKRSGRCLVTAAERNGVTLIAVTLNDPDDWRDHRALYDAAFPLCHAVTLAEAGKINVPVPCPGSEKGAIAASNDASLTRIFFGDAPKIRTVVETKRMLFPPVDEGDTVGRAVFYDGDGVLLGEVPLLARETVPGPEQSPGILERIFGGLRKPHLSDGR